MPAKYEHDPTTLRRPTSLKTDFSAFCDPISSFGAPWENPSRTQLWEHGSPRCCVGAPLSLRSSVAPNWNCSQLKFERVWSTLTFRNRNFTTDDFLKICRRSEAFCNSYTESIHMEKTPPKAAKKIGVFLRNMGKTPPKAAKKIGIFGSKIEFSCF